jgi:hypothetical protein
MGLGVSKITNYGNWISGDKIRHAKGNDMDFTKKISVKVLISKTGKELQKF